MELHANWNVSLADTLGHVMAHELGHLLLGSNSHSGMGIMRAHWQSEELRRLSRGGLWFTNEQADRMTGKLYRSRRQESLRRVQVTECSCSFSLRPLRGFFATFAVKSS